MHPRAPPQRRYIYPGEPCTSEIVLVLKFSKLDKEVAELEAVKDAALKVAREAGGPAAGEDEGVSSPSAPGELSREGAGAPKPGEGCN